MLFMAKNDGRTDDASAHACSTWRERRRSCDRSRVGVWHCDSGEAVVDHYHASTVLNITN